MISFSRLSEPSDLLDNLLSGNQTLLRHYGVSLSPQDFVYSRSNMNLQYNNPVALYNPSTFYRYQHDNPQNFSVNNNNYNLNSYGLQSQSNSHR